MAEITDLVDLSLWPARTRAIARREEPHPGAQLTFTDAEGFRYQMFITDLLDADVAYLEALRRGRGRAEKLICDLKATGLSNLPSAEFAIMRPGSPLPSWPMTCWPGHASSPSTAIWPGPNPSDCATASSTPPG